VRQDGKTWCRKSRRRGRRDENALHGLVRLCQVIHGLQERSVFAVRQKWREVDSDVGNSLFAQHVLNRMDVACGHELHAEDALVAHVPILIGKQHGNVEGRKLVDLDVLGILGQIGYKCRGRQEAGQDIGRLAE